MGLTEQIMNVLDHGKPLILHDAERALMKEDFEAAVFAIGVVRYFGLQNGCTVGELQKVLAILEENFESNSKS